VLLSAIPALIVSSWYYVHFHSKTGQTPAKKWLHIKVVDESGNLISRSRALVRWLILVVPPVVTCSVGYLIYLWPLFHQEHRALHDIIAKTYVVKE
jgi:uncharacterized RDD family membrane protein YckC